MSVGDHALGLCRRVPDAYQLNHLLDRKAMRDQDRLRASIGAGRKQLERAPAAAMGFGTMLAALLGCCGKNFLTCCSIGRVRSCVRPVCAAVKPLAIMLCADRVPIRSTHSKMR